MVKEEGHSLQKRNKLTLFKNRNLSIKGMPHDLKESKKIYVLNDEDADESPPKQSKIDDLFQNQQKYSGK
uniref:Uncharacterized protein n=1 Tax=Romanomermis culicivorax TaxID=13658 RepID=A0A915I8F7_ROMCU